MAARNVFSVRCMHAGRPVAATPRPAQLKVGILSDIQYANMDDAADSSGSKRYYRNALTSVEQAVSSWTLQNANCVVNLGDIIDAYNMVTDTSEQALQAVLEIFSKLPAHVDVRHVLGNHCVCHPVDRGHLLDTLGMVDGTHASTNGHGEHGYYAFVPADGWKLIVLDACDVSTYAWDKSHPNYRRAYDILTARSDNKLIPDSALYRKLLKAKKNEDIKEGDYTGNLEGLDQRFVFYNGAVSDEQLEWFDKELEDAKAAEQNVLVFSHMPLLPGICRPGMLLWNYDAVLDTIHAHGNRVKGVFCGHVHHFGFKRDDCGIPHMVLPAVLETAPGTDGHGMIEAHADRLIVNGFNRPEMIWEFSAQQKKNFGLFRDTARMASPAGV